MVRPCGHEKGWPGNQLDWDEGVGILAIWAGVVHVWQRLAVEEPCRSRPTRRTRDGDFYLATSEDLDLATHGDFLMATDKAMAWLQKVYQHQPGLFAHWQLVAFTSGRTVGAG